MKLLLLALAMSWAGQGQSTPTCKPPPSALAWNPDPAGVIHDVIWGYGDNITCHTMGSCNGSLHAVYDVSGPEEYMDVQIKPLEMQEGNVLRFTPSPKIGLHSFQIQPYRVDQQGFLDCDRSRGVAILEAATNETFSVAQHFLQLGSNYFIVTSEEQHLIKCHFGLRLNVTVKSSSCDDSIGALCSGWGVCVTFFGEPDFSCHCCGNYKGEHCDVYDSCLSAPCQNGGACFHPTNDSHKFACKCPLGFSGAHCENQTEDLCTVVDCHNNATCTGNKTHFHCNCPPGLTGTHCEVDINDCLPSPCDHGVCVDQRGRYVCYCQPGYHGDICSERHKMCSLTPCKNGGFCEDLTLPGENYQYACHCQPGWAGRDCSTRVSACEPNPCSRQGTCVEGRQNFTCLCRPGFTGSRCEVNINECEPNPCRFGGHCRDGVNSHSCLCLNSHAGSNCQYTLDVFSPVLEEVDASGAIIHDPSHTRNLYVVAGTLSTAVLLMLVVLVACYCRLSGGAMDSCCHCLLGRMGYKQYTEETLRVNVDVTSASDCPLAVDSFWSSDTDVTSLPDTTPKSSFGNQSV